MLRKLLLKCLLTKLEYFPPRSNAKADLDVVIFLHSVRKILKAESQILLPAVLQSLMGII